MMSSRGNGSTGPAVAALGLLFFSACGGDKSLSVQLDSSASPLFDAYGAGAGLAKIRVRADGPGQYDDVVVDLAADARSVTLKAPFEDGTLSVAVEGLDRDGNLVAYGAHGAIEPEADAVDIGFRRNVALVTHRPNPRQMRPASKAYVIDVASRGYIGEIALPGADAVGKTVSARGGDEMLVVYDVGSDGFVGILSADTGTWTSVPLRRRQDAAFASPVGPIAVAAGGGSLTYLDLAAGTVLDEFEIGGSVLDGAVSGDGHRAIVIVDLDPGVVIADLTDTCVKNAVNGRLVQDRCLVALDVVRRPGGVALSADGRRAFVVSSVDGAVASVDLVTLQVTPYLKGKFPVGVKSAAFSSEIQAVLAVQGEATGLGRVHTFVVASEASFSYDEAVQTQLFPSDISADPSGRRALVIAAGTSSASAGLTIVETSIDPLGELLAVPIGTTYLYPTDPDETYQDRNGVTLRQRYQPRSVAILNGR